MNIGEALGLLAYYESLDRVPSRKKMLNDFKQACKEDRSLEFLIWMLKDYPRFLSSVYRNKKIGILPSALQSKREEIENIKNLENKGLISSKLDSLMIKTAKTNKMLLKYLRAKLKRVSIEDFEVSGDVTSIAAFLLNNQMDYENSLLENYA